MVTNHSSSSRHQAMNVQNTVSAGSDCRELCQQRFLCAVFLTISSTCHPPQEVRIIPLLYKLEHSEVSKLSA